jgi:hypothetical protein
MVWGDAEGAPILYLHGTSDSRMLRDPTDTYIRHRLAACHYDGPG